MTMPRLATSLLVDLDVELFLELSGPGGDYDRVSVRVVAVDDVGVVVVVYEWIRRFNPDGTRARDEEGEELSDRVDGVTRFYPWRLVAFLNLPPKR